MEQEKDFRGKQTFIWRQIRIVKPESQILKQEISLFFIFLQLLRWRHFKEQFNCVKNETWKPARVTKCDLLCKCWLCKLKLSKGVLIYVSSFFKILNDAPFKTQSWSVTACSLYHWQRNLFVLYPRHYISLQGKWCVALTLYHTFSPQIFQSEAKNRLQCCWPFIPNIQRALYVTI